MKLRKTLLTIILANLMMLSFASAQNLLVNPGFETWDSGVPVSWEVESVVALTQETDPVFEGTYSLGLEATTSSNRGVYQIVPVTAGNEYEFSVYIFGVTSAGSVGIYLNWLNESGGVISGEGTFYTTGFGAYEEVTTGTIQAPAEAVNARCRIRCYANSTLGGYADAASVVDLGAGQPTPTPTASAPPTATPTGPTPTPQPVEAIKLNEVYINSPGSDTGCFVELYFPGGTSLNGYSLVGVNGNGGTVYDIIDLTGYSIPADGYFVIAQDDTVANYDLIDTFVDYQNGPDSVQLRMDETIVDAMGYGDFSSAVFGGEGLPVPYVSTEYSYSRIPDGTDTDDNSVDFLAGNLTAGEANDEATIVPTPTPTQGEPTATPTTGPSPTPVPVFDITINEVHFNTPGSDTECFVELYYDGGISLDGYSLVGVNGAGGTEYGLIDLTGYSIPADGFFVIAQADTVANYDLIDSLVNYQNGPDNIQLLAGDTVVDAIGYGDFTSAEFHGEGTPVPIFDDDVTYSRYPDGFDTDNNVVDFVPGLITAGTVNEEAPIEPTPTPTATPTGGICNNDGDVNLDGQLTAGDAQVCFYIVLGQVSPTYDEECAADCNGDGTVTAGDAQNIFLAVLGTGACVDPM